MKRVLYLDTFQPYMLSHRQVLDEITKIADEIIIGILGAQTSHTLTEPFTAGERMLMISKDLQNISRPVYIVPIEILGRNPLLVSHIISLVPDFSVVYTHDKLYHRLFSEAGITALHPPLIEHFPSPKDWVRLVLNGECWEKYVPNATQDVIYDIFGEVRLLKISETD